MSFRMQTQSPPGFHEDFLRFRDMARGTADIAPAWDGRHRSGGLLGLYDRWMRRLEEARSLREIDPHIARDIGIASGCDRCPDGFVADPRPLWNIGLTPLPRNLTPPWFRRRGS